jgi:hypothetical protein
MKIENQVAFYFTLLKWQGAVRKLAYAETPNSATSQD